MLELQLVYGVSGDAARNAKFLGRVLEYNATIGNLSKIVLGDFNVNLDGRKGMPPEMQAALHSGQLSCAANHSSKHRKQNSCPHTPKASLAARSRQIVQVDCCCDTLLVDSPPSVSSEVDRSNIVRQLRRWMLFSELSVRQRPTRTRVWLHDRALCNGHTASLL